MAVCWRLLAASGHSFHAALCAYCGTMSLSNLGLQSAITKLVISAVLVYIQEGFCPP